jgi:CubicO group peptidase (beta-lactamase class C family)
MAALTSPALQALLDQTLPRHPVPGAALAVWHGGEMALAASGVLDVERREPVRLDSMFQPGSVTKVLTATLVMQLHDQGLVDLDAPVRAWLPDFRIADAAASRAITVRQLLCHTSGMDGDFLTDTGNGDDRLARYVDRCAMLPLTHPVGGGFSYSNSAYIVAGRIVEVVTRHPFDTAMQKGLIDPLGLENSVCDPLAAVARSVASAHFYDPSRPARSRRVPTLYGLGTSAAPAGGTMLMSAADLLTFARMHLDDGLAPGGRRVLGASSAALMREQQVRVPLPLRDVVAWGLGWFIVEAGGRRMIGHDGAAIGQRAYLRLHRESGTIAVLMTNGEMVNDLATEIFARVLDPLTGVSPSAPPQAVAERPADLHRYAGTYRTSGLEATFRVEGDQLRRRGRKTFDDVVFDEPEATLAFAGNDTFLWSVPGVALPMSVKFIAPDAAGRPQALHSSLRTMPRVA